MEKQMSTRCLTMLNKDSSTSSSSSSSSIVVVAVGDTV